MRILILSRYDRLGASSRLRTLQYVDLLKAHGAHVEVQPFFTNDYVNSLYSGEKSYGGIVASYLRRVFTLLKSKKYDIIWTEKEFLPWVLPAIESSLSTTARRIVVDIDDAVFHRYDRHRRPAIRWLLGNKIDRVMSRATLVTAGNDYLAARATEAGARRVEVIPTVVDLERYAVPQYRDRGSDLRIGWIGSPSTAHYLKPISADLPVEVGGVILRYFAIGARGDQLEGTPFEAVAWSEESEVETISALDVGIMPLLDTPWERGKCGYKLVQYMACGLPVIASPVGVNPSIVGEAGLLASSGPEWRAAINRLVEYPQSRLLMGKRGRSRVEKIYSLQAQGPRLIELFEAAVS